MRLPLRIVRPVLAPTAAADVLAGAALVSAWDPVRLPAAVLASLCLYSGGMVQNDLCDREIDARKAPDRTLVVLPQLVRQARLLALALFTIGLLFAYWADVFWLALGIVACASAYNLGIKRYFPFDALTMGAARGLNLTLGLALGNALAGVWIAVGYALYIAAVTTASRAEDMEPPPTRRLVLLLSYLPQLAVYLVWAIVHLPRGLVFLLPAALQLLALMQAMRAGTSAAAKRYVLRSLLLIFALHACSLWTVHAPRGLITVLVCAGISFLLLGANARKDDRGD